MRASITKDTAPVGEALQAELSLVLAEPGLHWVMVGYVLGHVRSDLWLKRLGFERQV